MATNDIILNAPTSGIASSPFVGYADVRGLDVFTVPGVTLLSNVSTLNSATTVDNLVNWIVRDPVTTTKAYAVDNAGQVYVGTYATGAWSWAEVAGETAGGHGNGLCIWKDYLFVARDAFLDVYGPLSGSAAWSNSWQAIDSDALWHPMTVSKINGKLCGGAGKYIFTLDEATGTFAPGTGSTFTWTEQALDLPSAYRIKCLAELGNNLMIGTWQGSSVNDIRIADIFPWDYNSTSFSQPITLDEYGVHAMLNDGNTLIILAGINGRIYKSNGAYATPIAQLPQDLSGGKYLTYYPGAICNYKGRVFFGVSSGGTTTFVDGMGVYSLNQTGRGTVITLEHGISAANFGSASTVNIGALLPVSKDNLFISWRSGNT